MTFFYNPYTDNRVTMSLDILTAAFESTLDTVNNWRPNRALWNNIHMEEYEHGSEESDVIARERLHYMFATGKLQE